MLLKQRQAVSKVSVVSEDRMDTASSYHLSGRTFGKFKMPPVEL